jgi:hypothetical protein
MPMSPRDRRALLLMGSLLVVGAVVLFLFVLRGGEESPEAGAPPTGSFAPAPSPTPLEPDTKAAPERLVFSGRDPFNPAEGGGSIGPVVLPGEPSPGVAPASSPPPAPTGGSSANVGGKTVVLIDIFSSGGEEQAQVEVDGTVFTVGEGESFDSDRYELVSIDGTCADFLYGDQTFTLCETANK